MLEKYRRDRLRAFGADLGVEADLDALECAWQVRDCANDPSCGAPSICFRFLGAPGFEADAASRLVAALSAVGVDEEPDASVASPPVTVGVTVFGDGVGPDTMDAVITAATDCERLLVFTTDVAAEVCCDRLRSWGAVSERVAHRPFDPKPVPRRPWVGGAWNRWRCFEVIAHGTLDVRTSSAPRVAIGMTVHNGERYLRRALDSVLQQTASDVRWTILDDASTDASPAILAEYARRDPRIRLHRSEARHGLQGAWRRVFDLARADGPFEYFAWASDHDVWSACWLETLVSVLDRRPSCVLAHPLAQTVTTEGTLVRESYPWFHTSDLASASDRLARSTHRMAGAGNMVYGLFRAEALVACDVFRPVLLPDRLLVTELALEGRIVQVPRVLWFRRGVDPFSVARQRERLFAPEARPRSAAFPWWLVHGVALGRAVARRIRSKWSPILGLAAGARLAIVQGAKSAKQRWLGR